MKRIKNGLKYIQAFILALFVCLTVFSVIGIPNGTAQAESAQVTNVLDDLRKDENFKLKDYPENRFDYSLQVIQIAESKGKELYVYVYQPCGQTKALTATQINMSLSEDVTGTELYDLTLVNSSDVFFKYRVNGLTVSNAETRYYNVSSIYRAWDSEIDGGTGNNNTIKQKAFKVGKVFEVRTENGNVTYSLQPAYVVNIIEPYSDYLTYAVKINPPQGVPSINFSLHSSDVIDAHYIAFSTDWEIEKLISATVSYSYCSGRTKGDKFLFWELGAETTYGDEQKGYAYPTYLDRFEVTDSQWKGSHWKYNWDRIQRTSEFINSEQNLTDETKQNLSGKQWVLRFLETDREATRWDIAGYASGTVNFTKVDKVAVLRLEFETDGIVYNLGTVSDEVSGDGYPGNAAKPKPEGESFWDKVVNFFKSLWDNVKGFSWWQWLLAILGVLLGIGLIAVLVIFGVKAVFGVIWWLICLPFRVINKAVKRRKSKTKKERKANAKEKADYEE